MGKRITKILERVEKSLVTIIQEPGADQDVSWPAHVLLAILKFASLVFTGIVRMRLLGYRVGLHQRYPLGCQVISVGNITAGGTGKTPVVEKLARELQREGRKVAILSRGYRKKEAPWWRRKIEPPRVVSDGTRIFLDSEMGGDEPYMLANNLPGVAVVVDKNRVKAGRHAVKHFGCDTLVLDDGFQYLKLLHSLEVVLVDKTNPFGNGNLLPRGVLREPVKNLRRADFIFITKSDGNSASLRAQIRGLNPSAEIIECNHAPRHLVNAFTGEQLPLTWLNAKKVGALSGIAVPKGFENFLKKFGATLAFAERHADHHRYSAKEILNAINRAADLGASALVTTEKDAVRFPRLQATAVPVLYLRVEIELLTGGIEQVVRRICDKAPRERAKP